MAMNLLELAHKYCVCPSVCVPVSLSQGTHTQARRRGLPVVVGVHHSVLHPGRAQLYVGLCCVLFVVVDA